MSPSGEGWLTRISERCAVTLLALALAANLLLGSGASVTGRAVFQILVAAATALAVVAMTVAGRWRLPPSAVWFFLIPLPLIAVVQLAPLGNDWLGAPAVAWRLHPPKPNFITGAPHSTVQWMLWATAALALTLVAANLLATLTRVRVVLFTMLALLLLSGLIGGFQTLAQNRRVLGLWSIYDPATPTWFRDTFNVETAIGPVAFRPWRPTDEANDAGLWYAPKSAAHELFAGFLNPRHWGALVVICAPVLLALAILRAQQATLWGRTDWLGQSEGQRALLLIFLTALLVAAATWWGDWLPTAIGISVGGLLFVGMGGAVSRRWTLALAALLVGVALAGAATAVALQGGWELMVDRLAQWRTENSALLRALRDHGLFGCGFGAIADIWPQYAADPRAGAESASSLLALAVEAGYVGIALVGLGMVAFVLRWVRTAGYLDDESRLLAAGCGSALVAAAAVGIAGPGLEAPAVLAVSGVLLACLLRGVAGGFLRAGVNQ